MSCYACNFRFLVCSRVPVGEIARQWSLLVSLVSQIEDDLVGRWGGHVLVAAGVTYDVKSDWGGLGRLPWVGFGVQVWVLDSGREKVC
jgi:hypothetical protein